MLQEIGPHDDIREMRAFLWDMGLVDEFEAYCKVNRRQGMTDTKPLPSSTLPGFNPSGNPTVDTIKQHTEAIMQFITDAVPPGRRRSIALTGYEEAAMWAVKAATNPE